MRLLTIGVLAIGVANSACDRTGKLDATTTAPATTSAAAEPRPVATGSTAATAARTDATLPAAAVWHEVTIPAGTSLPLVLDTGVGSDISRVEQPVRAHLARAIAVHGQTVLAEGSAVSGVVTDAKRSGKVKGRAHVAVRFDTLTPRGGDAHYRIRTAAIGRTAQATKRKDALEIGGPAAGGAIIGAIVGGKKGAAIGTAAGGGAGTAVVLSTRGKEVHLAKGALVTVRLAEPVTVKVRG